MRNSLLGLLVGMLATGLFVYFYEIPKSNKLADEKYTAGCRVSDSTGMKKGYSLGYAQAKLEQKQAEDKLAAEKKAKEDARHHAWLRAQKTPKPIQNWHVYEGKIADPIE